MVIEDAKGYLLVRTNLELLEAPDVYIVASHCFVNHILLVGLTQSVGIVLHDAERRPRVRVDVATLFERDACSPGCQPLLGGATSPRFRRLLGLPRFSWSCSGGRA